MVIFPHKERKVPRVILCMENFKIPFLGLCHVDWLECVYRLSNSAKWDETELSFALSVINLSLFIYFNCLSQQVGNKALYTDHC